MKRFYLIVLCILSAVFMIAAGEYLKHDNAGTLSVLTDGGGDSTTGSGSFFVGETRGFTGLYAQIIISPAFPTQAGLGNADTGWVWLYTIGDGGNSYLVDSAWSAGLPCTLLTVLHSNVGDTLLRDMLRIDVEIEDTLGDDTSTVLYPVAWKIKLK